MRSPGVVSFAFAALSLAALLGLEGTGYAQCAMCRTALEQDGSGLALGFNRGILFLLAMPYVVFASIAGSWYWRRRSRGRGAAADAAASPREVQEAHGGLDGSIPCA